MRQAPTCRPVCWRSGGSPNTDPVLHLEGPTCSIDSTSFTRSGEAGYRENPARFPGPLVKLPWRRSPSILNDVPLRWSAPNSEATFFLKTLQRTNDVGSIPKWAATPSGHSGAPNRDTREPQSYSSRAIFPLPNEVRYSSTESLADSRMEVSGAQEIRSKHPLKPLTLRKDRHKVSFPPPLGRFEDRRKGTPTSALIQPEFDYAGALDATTRMGRSCGASSVSRRCSPFAIFLPCGLDRNDGTSFQQQECSCTQASWVTGTNKVKRPCLPSERSKQEPVTAPPRAGPMHHIPVRASSKGSKYEWCPVSKEGGSIDFKVCSGEKRNFSDIGHFEQGQRRLSCLSTVQPRERRAKNELFSGLPLSHLSVAVAEPPVTSHLQAAGLGSGGRVETESDHNEGRVDGVTCTSSITSAFGDYTFAPSSFSSESPRFLSSTDIPYMSPEEQRLHEEDYMRCPVKVTLLDRFRAYQQTSTGPTESDSTSSRKGLLSCDHVTTEEKCKPNSVRCRCTLSPLDTLEEPVAYSRFTAVAIFAGEPAETPRTKASKTKNVEGNAEEGSCPPTQLPGLQSPSLLAASVIDSPEPLVVARRTRAPSISARSPHMTQGTTTPERPSQQEEESPGKSGKESPGGKQQSTQRNGKQCKQKTGGENSRRQRTYPSKQTQRDRMRQQYEQAQHHGGKETEKQGNQCEQQERMQQAGPLELHEKQTNSSQNEEREKECLELREEGAHKGGDIDGSELQELQRQALPLDGSIPSSTSHRSSQGVPFAVHCKEPAKGKQSKATGKPRNEEGEQPSLAFERISEKWLKHEMQALLREECHQRQIVKRRDEQQHESLQHHPPLERPCVPHEQKQQVEDLWDMHQPACQQMQQELVSRHEGHIQARPHERITAQQEKLKKGKHAAIHLKQQEKQSNQKQLKIQQPTSGSKQRSVPLIRRRSTCCQPWEEDIQEDQPFETPKMGEQKEEQLLAKQKQLEEPQEEGQQTLRQHEKAKHQQLHSPAGETGEDSGEAPKQEEQQVGPRQQKSTTCETEEVKPSRSKKPMEVLQRHQQLTQSQQQATQVHMQEQHEAPIQEDARQSLQLNEVTLQEASRQKVQQALQKGRKPTHLQKCQQKQQLLTKQEGYHQQQLKEEREQTQTRQETQAERQKTQGNQEQKEDRLEGNQNPRGQKQQGPYEEVPQRQEHSTEGLNSTEHQKEKESPEKSTPQKELTKQDGQQNGQQESLEGELPLQTEQQPLSTEKHKIENQQHGVREMNRREGQILEENQRLQTEQHKSLPNHRCFQQKAPQHDLSKGSLPQTQVQSLQQQPHQQQQERQQEQKQQQKRQRQQQHDIHQQKDQAPEQQVPPQQQGQRPKGHPEGNSALTRRELLRLSFVPLLAVNENEYYLQHHRPSNTTSSSPLMPWRTTTSTQQRPVRRMPLPDNPSQPLVTTPRRRPYEGQRSGDADAKAPAQAFQQPNGRHGFSKTQQHLLNQHWTPLEVSHQQTSVNKQAADGASRNSFRRKNHILIPPPPPPAAFTQLTHHSHEQWRMAPTRGSYQPKNPRARQRLLQQEQRRLQKEPKKAAADLPLQAPEDFARHPETQQNLHRQSADLQQGLQQHQQLHGCDQQVQRELAAPRPCKRGDKRSSRGSHSGACGPDSAFPFTATPGSRKTWAQKAVELPPKRELGNSKDRRTDGVHRSFIDAEEYVVGADHRRGDNEKPESGYHDRRDRRFGKSDTFPTQHPPTMQAHTLRQGRQALQAQAAEQQQGNTRNPIVLQVHQQLTQARLEFLEETARGQARLSRLQAEKEARQKEEQQEQNVEQPKPEQGEQRHGVFQPDQQHQYQQQRQQQQHEEHENSMLHQHPPHYQQQTVNGPGQQPLHEQERQQAQDSQHEEQQHPYGVQQSLQQPSLTEQQLQQDTEVANLLGASIQQSLYTHSPSQALHQLQQQQLHQGIELPHEHEGLLSGFQRQQCQPQDTCGQQGTRQPQQLLGVQEQQVWLQRHEQLEHRYQQEQVQHIQQQQDQLPLQQPLIYRQQYTTLPQQPYHVLQQQYPLAEQQQQAWLQLQLHLSLQQHQHAWFLMNQQRSWLLQQQHAWTPNQQHLWALQQQEFWRQQQHLWQLQQPHVWLQQQQHLWLQHHQQASIQQQLLHQQQQQQQDQLQQHGPAPFQHHVNYCNSYIPPHVLSGVILVAAENAENIRQFSSCGVKMPPPWDGCIPSGNIRLGFCRACLQYVHLDAHLLPFISATTAASSPTLVEGSEEPAGYFNGQGPHQAEFLPHEQRLSTASADAAGGPPGISSLQERACEGPGGSAEIQDDMLQQNSANAAIANNSSHDSQSMHTSSSSSNNDREAYNEYPASNSNTSGNNRVYNSCSNNSTGSTAQRNHHTSRRTWEEGGNSSSNNNGSSSMAGHFANFEAFESFRFSAQNTRRPSGQIDSTGTPAATANAGASILQTNTQDTYQTQLNQPLQQQLYKGSLPLRGLVTGDTADPSYRNAGGFSSFNPSAPVFVPVRIAQPTSPSFAAAVAATAAAANQESLSAGAQASPAVEIRPGNNEPTSVQRPISSCGQTFPVILQQQPQSQEQLQQLHNVNQPGEQNRALQVPLPHASGPHTCDGQSHIQQPQHTSQTMHQFVEAYQHSYSQNHQQQRNGHQQNEQQQNEQQQSSRTHVQQQPQWSQYHFPSPIPGSISGFVSSADSSTPQGSLLIIGACLQCWQFVIRPPALCLLDQFRARGTGLEEFEGCQHVRYEE